MDSKVRKGQGGVSRLKNSSGAVRFRALVQKHGHRLAGPLRATKEEAEADRAAMSTPAGWQKAFEALRDRADRRKAVKRQARKIRRVTTSTVYFIQSAAGGPIKIGLTTALSERLRAFQTHSPYPLRVLATMPGGDDVELDIHSRFAHLRAGGEWFEPAPELLAFVAEAALGERRGRSARTVAEMAEALRALAKQLEDSAPRALDEAA